MWKLFKPKLRNHVGLRLLSARRCCFDRELRKHFASYLSYHLRFNAQTHSNVWESERALLWIFLWIAFGKRKLAQDIRHSLIVFPPLLLFCFAAKHFLRGYGDWGSFQFWLRVFVGWLSFPFAAGQGWGFDRQPCASFWLLALINYLFKSMLQIINISYNIIVSTSSFCYEFLL